MTARLTRRTSYALPKLAVPYFLYPIHVAAIVIEGYLKQINLYHTHHTGAVTGEAFLFLASATTLFLKVCVIHMILFCHNLQCHYYEYSMQMKSAA